MPLKSNLHNINLSDFYLNKTHFIQFFFNNKYLVADFKQDKDFIVLIKELEKN